MVYSIVPVSLNDIVIISIIVISSFMIYCNMNIFMSSIYSCALVFLFTGNYLFEKLKKSDTYEVCFIWNRTADKMTGIVPVDLILDDLRQAHTR